MHEFGLCEGIVEAVQRRAAGRRVARVKVRVGVLHRVVGEAFQLAFGHAAEGTEAENAAVELIVVPARARCQSCAAETEAADWIDACSRCGGVNVELIAGDEMILESIEYAAAWTGA